MKALYLAVPGALAMLATGKLTGIVLDVGDTSTTVLPIHNGRPLLHAALTKPHGGRDITNYMMTHLLKGNCDYVGSANATMFALLSWRVDAAVHVKCTQCPSGKVSKPVKDVFLSQLSFVLRVVQSAISRRTLTAS